MGRRGRGEGNLFDGADGPEDAIPSLGDLVRGSGRPRRTRASRAPRPVGPLRYGVHQRGPVAVRRALRAARAGFAAVLLALGLVMTVTGALQAAEGYSAAGTLAAAPACPAGVDPTTTTRDCVADVTLTSEAGVWDDDGEESIDLFKPPQSAFDYFTPTFPGDAAFANAVNTASAADDYTAEPPVRAEFWEGGIVELTAAVGTGAVTVTTGSNPNDQGGIALGTALVGLALAEFGLLLFIGIRALRQRWLRPGSGLHVTVSSLIVTALGLFVAGICLINQPALVLTTLAVASAVTAFVLLVVDALVVSSWLRPGRSGHTSIRVTSP